MFERTKNDNLYTHIFSQEQYFFHQTELKALFCNPLDNHFNPELEKLNRILSPTEEQGLLDMKHYLKDDLLVKVDRASMYHSIELREPLLDYRLVEFALNIAPSLKIKDNQAKYILKQVLYDYLPESLFERPKWGFSIPMARWLKHDIRYIIEENLSKSVIESFGIVHYHKVKELIDAFDAGRDYYYNRIWVLASLHAWLRENS